MVKGKEKQERNEQYVRATLSHFLSGKPTYMIQDETGRIMAMAMDEPVIKNAQAQIVDHTNKYYEYTLMRMVLEPVDKTGKEPQEK